MNYSIIIIIDSVCGLCIQKFIQYVSQIKILGLIFFFEEQIFQSFASSPFSLWTYPAGLEVP